MSEGVTTYFQRLGKVRAIMSMLELPSELDETSKLNRLGIGSQSGRLVMRLCERSSSSKRRKRARHRDVRPEKPRPMRL